MKTKRKTSQWKALAWETVDVKSSQEKDNDEDDSQFLNAKNHYDDPEADPSDLYDGMGNTGYGGNAVEGANDPGIFVGLEVIDGSQYEIEKIAVGKGASAGYITRLVVNEKESQPKPAVKKTKVLSVKKDKESRARKSKGTEVVTKSKAKKPKINEESKIKTDQSSNEVDPQKLSRKQKNRLKLEKLKAKRLEKKADRQKRKLEEISCTNSKSDQPKIAQSPVNANDQTNNKKKQKKAKQSNAASQAAKSEIQSSVAQEDIDTIRDSWSVGTGGVYLHEKICASLHQMQFASPTPIQASTLAGAILGQRDIVGAAPTGSGKTLSYLLPILQYLLSAEDELKGSSEGGNASSVLPPNPKLTALVLCPTRELAMQVSNEYSKLVKSTAHDPYHNRINCGSIVGGLSEQKQKRILNVKRPPVLVATPGRLWDLMSSGEHEHLSDLTQLRFLVIDEADRMVSQGSFPQLSNILQNVRLANPSLEDMEDSESEDDDEDECLLKGLPGVRGEAKVSMLNDDILKMIKEQSRGENPTIGEDTDAKEDSSIAEEDSDTSRSSEDDELEEPVKRQTFIFSATLTLPSSSQENSTSARSNKGKKRNSNLSVDGAIAEILEKVGAQGETKIVDLSTEIKKDTIQSTRKQKDADASTKKEFILPPGLSLYEIRCTQKHKDSHLYSFLTTTKQGCSGPCLVFCNSIGAVKRVGETLKTLGLPARMLHAQMQQKSRMSAVESITKSKSRSIVIATDVAARGLDIPSVATVIHYDVPRATDLFVHRAGRTARGMGQNAIGWSVSLVSAPEEKSHRLICGRVLGGEKTHFDNAPMDGRLLSIAHERVNLATKIVACASAESRTNKSNQWFINAANDADLDVDENMLDDGLVGGNDRDRQLLLEAKRGRQQLRVLLATPMRTQSYGKFLSGAGLTKSIQTEQEVKPFVVKNEPKNSLRKKKRKK